MESLMGQGADGKVHPVPGFGRAQTRVRASAALAGSGAFTSATAWDVPDGVQKVSVAGTYTRGMAGGLAVLRLKWTVTGVDGVSFYDTTQDQALAISAPDGTSSFYRTVIACPAPSSSSALSFVLAPLDVPPGATSLTIEAAEADATKASPGTLTLYVAAGF